MSRYLMPGLLCLLFPAVLLAHGMTVTCRPDADRMKVAAFYPGDGAPAAFSTVSVLGEDDRMLAEGKTDAHGFFWFHPEVPPPFRIMVEQGAHKGTCQVAAAASANPAVVEDRKDPFPTASLLAGMAFIFSLASFAMAVLMWRRMRPLLSGQADAAGARDARRD